ncbi:BTAD domain-containing putative transcriptional regulator [Amycolatopsis umgeniensis]|uniref:DNA-binding SARP family transcriptional activator n=1 Tax=Amycolatopsis umgeniensis TaxID=336628 RepID=A0A841AWK7_9PSEU|nr:AfsR/SARP family transcriptional regulator [Amycolatopsis umgeniensis]MBB5851283.1 DNA-binding SARP family transcriptional activator [Amycolatopsis umgeniensis]
MLFQLLGPLEVQATIKPGKPATVLAALLLDRGRWVGVDSLIDSTWHDRPAPVSAAGNLKSHICGLRRVLPPPASGDRIESRQGAYRIRVAPDEVDVDLADLQAAEAGRAFAVGEPERAAELLADGLALWRGRPFEGLQTPAAAVEGARLARLHTRMREDLAEAYHRLGRYWDAITVLHGLLDEDPLREHAWAKLIRLLTDTGRRNEALTTYGRARSIIVRELGVEPGAVLLSAHHDALRGCADLHSIAG